MAYATTLQLATVLGIARVIPFNNPGDTPAFETVGTGDDSATLFHLDQRNILTGTLSLSFGATAASTTALVLTTDYTINLTTGAITLTSAGVTAVGTDDIFAESYQYVAGDLSDAYLTDVIARADLEVDIRTNSTFTDGTGANPAYTAKTDNLASQGIHNRWYFTTERPVKDVNSLLATTITASDTTLDVTAGEGTNFPSTGTIVMGTEKITYTGVSTDTLTGLTRGVGDSTASIHTAADEIHTTVVEISATREGAAPTFNTLSWKNQVFIDPTTGKIEVYHSALSGITLGIDVLLPRQDVSNRVQVTYLHGFDTIPVTITRLSLLLAKRMLMQDTVSRSIVSGRDEFSPEMFNIDQHEIDMILSAYTQLAMGNT